jgi:HEPN domain-containing protein
MELQFMSGSEPPELIQWREARRWLAKAEEDLAAAQVLSAGNLLDPAAFHLQQALEKALKALAVAAGRDIRRTHDLETLMSEAHQSWPSLVSFPSPLANVSEWYLVSRYPDMDELAPTSDEIADAFVQIVALVEAIKAVAPPMERPPKPGERP